MKISIITVAYNSAITIADTLISVAGQTYPDVQHIVIDGSSSDETMAVIARVAAPSTKVVSEPDRGIYDAMNKGLRLATGDLIGFLNADDVFAHKDVLADLASAAQRHPDVDVLYGDLVYVSAGDPGRVLRHWRSGPFSVGRLRFGWMPPHPTLYVTKRLLMNVGPFDAELRIAGDYEFVLRCLTRSDVKVTYVPEVLVRMRTGGASNRSIDAVKRKMREDLVALRRYRVSRWPMLTLLCKSLRKLPQFLPN